MDDFKWPAIMFSCLFIGMGVSFSVEAYVEKPALTKLQMECVEQGYGKMVNGKFELVKK